MSRASESQQPRVKEIVSVEHGVEYTYISAKAHDPNVGTVLVSNVSIQTDRQSF